mgnify:FL=1|tara:strand:+ start:232 stop:723 length:492 start_codon:yes stop_codon:yes gene_type:complete
MIKYKYPKSFWKIAEEIGNARNVLNINLKEKNPRYDRGTKNIHVDITGILGELIAMDYLTNQNIDYKMAKLLDFFPSKIADIVVKNKRMDVKTTIHFPSAHLLVNQEAHIKGLNLIDKYWFIYVLDKENAEFYFVDYNEINYWECKKMGYTKAYKNKRENLIK